MKSFEEGEGLILPQWRRRRSASGGIDAVAVRARQEGPGRPWERRSVRCMEWGRSGYTAYPSPGNGPFDDCATLPPVP